MLDGVGGVADLVQEDVATLTLRDQAEVRGTGVYVDVAAGFLAWLSLDEVFEPVRRLGVLIAEHFLDRPDPCFVLQEDGIAMAGKARERAGWLIVDAHRTVQHVGDPAAVAPVEVYSIHYIILGRLEQDLQRRRPGHGRGGRGRQGQRRQLALGVLPEHLLRPAVGGLGDLYAGLVVV